MKSAIREEHSALTKNLSSAEYAKRLEEETAPIRLELERLKKNMQSWQRDTYEQRNVKEFN